MIIMAKKFSLRQGGDASPNRQTKNRNPKGTRKIETDATIVVLEVTAAGVGYASQSKGRGRAATGGKERWLGWRGGGFWSLDQDVGNYGRNR